MKKGLKAINDDTRSGKPKIIDGDIEAHVVPVVCSNPPDGSERWTKQLIAIE